MYFLVLANTLDSRVLSRYEQSLPESQILLQGADMAVYSCGGMERGQREAVYNISAQHQYNHLFFDASVRCFENYSLLMSDMDSTLITMECIDVMAEHHGCADQVSRLTAEAMADPGVNYEQSLRQRVRLLSGFETTFLPSIYDCRLSLTPGAERLLHLAHNSQMYTTIVSGGFTYFTKRLCKQLGMSAQVGNVLEIKEGKLTGELLGDLVDATYKARDLRNRQTMLGLTRDDVIALGDGANDLLMMRDAGLAVAFRPKAVVGRYADAVLFNSLDLLVELLKRGQEFIKKGSR